MKWYGNSGSLLVFQITVNRKGGISMPASISVRRAEINRIAHPNDNDLVT